MLTLGQAAKETGVSKPTISKAISKGRLSGTKNEKGEYQIDPAELFRVFPLASKQPVSDLQSETHIYTNELQRELDVLQEERTRERQQLETTIADLRAERERLLSVIEEQAGSVKQLTYQPKPEQTTNQKMPGRLDRAFNVLLVAGFVAVVLIAGAIVAFWTGFNQVKQ